MIRERYDVTSRSHSERGKTVLRYFKSIAVWHHRHNHCWSHFSTSTRLVIWYHHTMHIVRLQSVRSQLGLTQYHYQWQLYSCPAFLMPTSLRIKLKSQAEYLALYSASRYHNMGNKMTASIIVFESSCRGHYLWHLLFVNSAYLARIERFKAASWVEKGVTTEQMWPHPRGNAKKAGENATEARNSIHSVPSHPNEWYNAYCRPTMLSPNKKGDHEEFYERL